MHKKSTILSCLLLLACCCMAQPVSDMVRRKLIDQYNYRLVHFSLVAGTKAQEAFNDAFYNYAVKYNIYDTTYDRVKTSIPASLYKTKAICDEIESIKSKSIPLNVKDLLPYYLAELVADEKEAGRADVFLYPQLNAFYNKRNTEQRENFKLFKVVLAKTLEYKLKKLEGTNSNDTFSSKKTIFKRMTEWIVEHATLVVAAILILIWFVSAGASSNTDTKIRLVNKKIDALTNQSGNKNQQLLNERNEERLQKLEAETFAGVWAAYLELKDHTDKLTARLKLIETKQPAAAEKKKETTVVLQPFVVSTSAGTVAQKKLFFPVPDKKTGHFRAVLGKDSISGYTVYQFAIDAKDVKKAAFSLIRTPQVEAAVLNFPESYLLHACDTEGTPGINKKIETITAGVAQLDGDYWTIQKKALIRYV
jgi:hypothetical protein